MANASSMAKLTYERPEAGAAAAMAGGSGQAVLDSVAGASGVIPCVTLEDAAVTRVKNRLSSLLDAVQQVVEKASRSFSHFAFLFSEQERQSMFDLVTIGASTAADGGGSGFLQAYTQMLRRYDSILSDIASAGPDVLHCGFVSLDTAALKQALCGRVRLLCSSALKHLKAQSVFACETLNAQYESISHRLREPEADGIEGLTSLHAFAESVPAAVSHLDAALRASNGPLSCLRLVYGEGLQREFNHKAELTSPVLIAYGPGGGGATSGSVKAPPAIVRDGGRSPLRASSPASSPVPVTAPIALSASSSSSNSNDGLALSRQQLAGGCEGGLGPAEQDWRRPQRMQAEDSGGKCEGAEGADRALRSTSGQLRRGSARYARHTGGGVVDEDRERSAGGAGGA